MKQKKNLVVPEESQMKSPIRKQKFLSFPFKLPNDASLIPVERIERAIFLIRGQKVMLDRDLAELPRFKKAARLTLDRFQKEVVHAESVRPEMNQTTEPEGKIGRNAPCPCGSGKKYKKCCGRDQEAGKNPKKGS